MCIKMALGEERPIIASDREKLKAFLIAATHIRFRTRVLWLVITIGETSEALKIPANIKFNR